MRATCAVRELKDELKDKLAGISRIWLVHGEHELDKDDATLPELGIVDGATIQVLRPITLFAVDAGPAWEQRDQRDSSRWEQRPVEVRATCAVRELKDELCELKDELKDTWLVHGGRVLDEDKATLPDLGIVDGSTIWVLRPSEVISAFSLEQIHRICPLAHLDEHTERAANALDPGAGECCARAPSHTLRLNRVLQSLKNQTEKIWNSFNHSSLHAQRTPQCGHGSRRTRSIGHSKPP